MFNPWTDWNYSSNEVILQTITERIQEHRGDKMAGLDIEYRDAEGAMQQVIAARESNNR